ncbi:hypothetical protein F53441_14408 [Fusarium austroafricanum]|uniref:Heterokaryon incompatibility domain-containing protein n=1 Tax=Fusarium austroafricanum TaxID=2364996 RepID=A0A8H4NKI1_9HYPO|nr:hypothetical protein F53441_14408 [Fusarium austroafricanum]
MVETNPTAEAVLCSRCQSFDLTDMLSGRWTDSECRNPVAVLGKRSAILSGEKCPLCQALFSIAAGEHDTETHIREENDQFCMFAIPSQLAYRSQKQHVPFDLEFGDRFLERAKAQGDSTWLVVRNKPRSMMDHPFWFNIVPRSAHNFGCLAAYTDAFNGAGQRVRLIDPAKVDFDAVKRWLAFCQGNHKEHCNPVADNRSLPRGFSVISCTSRKLEPLPFGARFAALSYVWGENTANAEPCAVLGKFPQTIEDTITVALEIGIQFIWVDRYCVPQHECSEKREQIQMMHKIYREADLTIIAAAGDGPKYGLPGISAIRTKAPSVDIQIGPHRLVSTEGLVSRRKLIFTDEQVYLHCMEREFRETIEQDFELLAKSDSDDLSDPFKCQRLHYIPENHNTEAVYWLAADFSDRNITFQNDTLNAFLGILNLFQDAYPDSFRHIWGQPIPYNANHSIGDVVVFALIWGLRQGAKRRPEFPSWSWVGWKGKAFPWISESYPEDITASLLLEDGTVIKDAQVLRDLPTFQSLSTKLSRYLLIEAETVNVRIRRQDSVHWRYKNRWKVSFVKGDTERHDVTYGDGLTIMPEFSKGDEIYKDLEAGLIWLGIAFPCSDMVIVLKDMGGYYEKFGYIDVDFSIPDRELATYLLGRKEICLG